MPFIFQLLHAKNVHANVRKMIMEMVEHLLGMRGVGDEGQPEGEETEMETDEEVPPIEAGESVLDDIDKGKKKKNLPAFCSFELFLDFITGKTRGKLRKSNNLQLFSS